MMIGNNLSDQQIQAQRCRKTNQLSSPKSKSKISNPKIQGFGLWLTIKLLGPPTHHHPPTTFKSIKPVQIQSLKSFRLWVHHFQQNFTLIFQDL